jgi:hypothetical protein
MKTNHVKMLLSAMVVFLIAWGFSACSSNDSTPKVVKTDLIAAVAAANTLISTTHEGVGTGDYLKGSQAPLIAAIEQAQLVVDNTAATKAQVTAAVANLAAAVATYQSNKVTPIDPTNLVGQWTFDEIASATVGATVKDYSGNNHDGTIKAGPAGWGSGVPALTTDRYGNANKALLFDKGANIEIPYSTALNPATLSISAWVKLSEVRNNRFIGLHSWIGYKFEVQDANYPFATVGYNGGSYDRAAGAALTQNTWYHLVVTFTAGEMVFYINGTKDSKVQDATPEAAVSIAGDPYNLVFGEDFPADQYAATTANFDTDHKIPLEWGSYLHGSLDEIRIYKSVLTPTQVTSIYNAEKP